VFLFGFFLHVFVLFHVFPLLSRSGCSLCVVCLWYKSWAHKHSVLFFVNTIDAGAGGLLQDEFFLCVFFAFPLCVGTVPALDLVAESCA